MRDLRFRAWNPEEGCFTCADNISEQFFANPVVHPDGTGQFVLDSGCDLFIVEQYTGLKDKNGVDIYEGDIIHAKLSMSPYERDMKDKHRVVVHSNYRISGFVLDTVDGETVYSGKGLCTTNAKHMEVIGNIHQNPELLEAI